VPILVQWKWVERTKSFHACMHSVLQSENSSLESEFSTLTSNYDNLEDNYTNLNSDFNELLERTSNMTYSELLEAYELLDTTYNQLKTDYEEIQTDYEEAETRIAELERLINEVHVLIDKEYYNSIKDDLKKANETILIAMYSMIYDPDDSFDWANDLIRELVYAYDRGVNVSVVIEYRTYFGYMNDNMEAYNYLLSHNVDVQLDNEKDTDHLKLVIIDDRIVYVGSHNWSESGLYYNYETSVKIVSEDIAQTFREYLETTFGI